MGVSFLQSKILSSFIYLNQISPNMSFIRPIYLSFFRFLIAKVFLFRIKTFKFFNRYHDTKTTYNFGTKEKHQLSKYRCINKTTITKSSEP